MIAQVKDNGGTKTLEQISGSIPTGNPVGTLLTTYKKIQPRNYLYCDGSTFNAGQYPALYLYLGTNVLPDYRECTMVGAEENTTDTIATHDVYAQGEFKDDQFQGHRHKDKNQSGSTGSPYNTPVLGGNASSNTTDAFAYTVSTDEVNGEPRTGTTTHGKQKAVYVYIKAVDGVDISDEDTFLVTVKNFVEEKNSYSTTEMLTGGKWIDGKPIYRRVFVCATQKTISAGWNTLTNTNFPNITDLLGVETIVNANARTTNAGYLYNIFILDVKTNNQIRFYGVAGNTFNIGTSITVEYTKTTD